MTFRCHRCGREQVRLTKDQVHCLPCAMDVAERIAADEKRRTPRFPVKDTTAWGPAL